MPGEASTLQPTYDDPYSEFAVQGVQQNPAVTTTQVPANSLAVQGANSDLMAYINAHPNMTEAEFLSYLGAAPSASTSTGAFDPTYNDRLQAYVAGLSAPKYGSYMAGPAAYGNIGGGSDASWTQFGNNAGNGLVLPYSDEQLTAIMKGSSIDQTQPLGNNVSYNFTLPDQVNPVQVNYNTPVRLVDKDMNVLYSGVGFEGAQQMADMAQKLHMDKNIDLQLQTASPTNPTEFRTASGLYATPNVVGEVLTQIGPILGGALVPGLGIINGALGAGVGAAAGSVAGGIASGKSIGDILKGAAIAGGAAYAGGSLLGGGSGSNSAVGGTAGSAPGGLTGGTFDGITVAGNLGGGFAPVAGGVAGAGSSLAVNPGSDVTPMDGGVVANPIVVNGAVPPPTSTGGGGLGGAALASSLAGVSPLTPEQAAQGQQMATDNNEIVVQAAKLQEAATAINAGAGIGELAAMGLNPSQIDVARQVAEQQKLIEVEGRKPVSDLAVPGVAAPTAPSPEAVDTRTIEVEGGNATDPLLDILRFAVPVTGVAGLGAGAGTATEAAGSTAVVDPENIVVSATPPAAPSSLAVVPAVAAPASTLAVSGVSPTEPPAQPAEAVDPENIVVNAAPPADLSSLIVPGGAALGVGGLAALGSGTTAAVGAEPITVTGNPPLTGALDPVIAPGAVVAGGLGTALTSGGVVDPNEIVVQGAGQTGVDASSVIGGVGAGAAVAGAGGAATETTPKTTKQKIIDALTLAGLGSDIIGSILGGGGGGLGGLGGVGGMGSLGSTFNATLPTAGSIPGGVGTAANLAARTMPQQDWTKYGMRPEQSFFNYVPSTYTPPAANTPDPLWDRKAKGGLAVKGRPSKSTLAMRSGRSDDIPAMLSDGEYVIDAETVALLGDGSNKAGADKLDQFRVNLRKHKGRQMVKGKFSLSARSPEGYMAGGRA